MTQTNGEKKSVKFFDALTRKGKISFPLPALDDQCMKVVATAIINAYSELVASDRKHVLGSDEIELNFLLENKLNDAIIDGKNLNKYFLAVVRGAENPDSSLSQLEKRPDLQFLFKDNFRRKFPLMVEAKIINEKKSHHRVDIYFSKGVKKFLDGRYAPGSQEGMMIAYVKDGSNIAAKFVPFLKSVSTYNGTLPEFIADFEGDLAVTRHNRSLEIPNGIRKSPLPFNLWHLWLN